MSGPGLLVAGLRSLAELSTGPTGGRGIGWMTGTGTQMAGNADPHYVQTLDAHSSEKGPGELQRNGRQGSCVRTRMTTTELMNDANSERALREWHEFLLSRVEGWT
eukprot:590853-Rhodomonas_salina.1